METNQEDTCIQPYTHYNPAWVHVQTEGSSAWFLAEDVCAAIGMPLLRIKYIPEHTRKKAAIAGGKVVHMVNAEGLLCLLGQATRNTSNRAHLPVHTLHAHVEGQASADMEATRIVEGGRRAIAAVMQAFPQRPRNKRKD
ncbi:hypothetical protein, partial [Aquabacterium sp.]|uniref:hypothetical protein n=1 Tax=Aquabacterium sp. TaxID=1872578 RepID=UPI0025C1AB4C